MNKDADDQHLVDTEARANQIVMLTTDKIKAQSENESIRIDLNNLKNTHGFGNSQNIIDEDMKLAIQLQK